MRPSGTETPSLGPLPPTGRMKHLHTFLIGLAVLAGPGAAAAPASGPVVTTPRVRAELVAHAPEGVLPGKPLWLGLKIDHQKDWHTYWKNPGDSGLPTKLNFTLADGLQAGEVQWPTPSRLPTGPLMNYGYADTLLLPVPVTVPEGFKADSLEVKLQAEWLVCRDVCIPESGEFSLRLPAQAATAVHGALFTRTQASVPQPATGAQATAAVNEGALAVQVQACPPPGAGRRCSSSRRPQVSSTTRPCRRRAGKATPGRLGYPWTRSAPIHRPPCPWSSPPWASLPGWSFARR